jgi:hypothetical protein
MDAPLPGRNITLDALHTNIRNACESQIRHWFPEDDDATIEGFVDSAINNFFLGLGRKAAFEFYEACKNWD